MIGPPARIAPAQLDKHQLCSNIADRFDALVEVIENGIVALAVDDLAALDVAHLKRARTAAQKGAALARSNASTPA